MRILCLLLLLTGAASAQGTVPTFSYKAGDRSYTLAGADPARGGTTTIPVLLVPVALSFDAKRIAGKPFVMDAARRRTAPATLACLLEFRFPSGGNTQYADAMLRTTFPRPARGIRCSAAGGEAAQDRRARRLRVRPHVEEDRRVLRGRRYRVPAKGALQADFPKQDGKLVIAMTHNTTYYAAGDATSAAPGERTASIPPPATLSCSAPISMTRPPSSRTRDVQPLTQQLARIRQRSAARPAVPRPQRQGPGKHLSRLDASGEQAGCGGTGVAIQLVPARTHQH